MTAPQPPASLIQYLREGRCVLFCGSGLSAWGNLPTWTGLLKTFLRQIQNEMPNHSDLEELNRLLKSGKLLEVADHCKEVLGQQYHTVLSEELRGVTEQIPEPHRMIVQLPFSAIVTTNYDKLLERAYAGVTNLPRSPTHLDVDTLGPLLFDGGFFILKAHGDIDRPDSLVLTARDYQNIIHANPAFNMIFSAILLTKAILFVGYSLNDPDFRLLLDRQLTHFRGHVPARYALMSGVGKVERDLLWRTARIRVLSYPEGEHKLLLNFLQTMQNGLAQRDERKRSLAPDPPVPDPRVPDPPLSLDVSEPVSLGRGVSSDELEENVEEYDLDAVARSFSVSLPKNAPEPDLAPSSRQDTLMLEWQGSTLEVSLHSGSDIVQGLGDAAGLNKIKTLMANALYTEENALLVSRKLAECLPEVVHAKLKQEPSDRTLELDLSSNLEFFPWEWLDLDDQFLCLQRPLLRSPIGIDNTARGYPILRKPSKILLIGDPNKDDGMPLPGARQEVEEIAALYRQHPEIDCHLLVGSDATFSAVAGQIASGAYDVVHFAGHAGVDDQESFLQLSGSVQLRTSEMRSMLGRRPPAILFLNSHYTVFVPFGVAGSESETLGLGKEGSSRFGQRGFTEAVLTAGVGTIVGSFSDALEDEIAQCIGVSFHKALLEKRSTAEALHLALLGSQMIARRRGLQQLSYSMSGYGDLALP